MSDDEFQKLLAEVSRKQMAEYDKALMHFAFAGIAFVVMCVAVWGFA